MGLSITSILMEDVWNPRSYDYLHPHMKLLIWGNIYIRLEVGNLFEPVNAEMMVYSSGLFSFSNMPYR